MAQVSIIIPAYNEEGAIGAVLQELRALPLESEIIVVDDGSTDQTGRVAAENGARVVRHAMNAGYGRSVKDGIRAATADIIVVTDADGTYPIASIPLLVETLGQGFDMVVGARQGKEYRGSYFKMPMRLVLKFLVEFTTGRHIPDINSGLRAFRRRLVIEYFDDLCNGFSFTTTITLVYLLTGKMVTYVPIAYHKRIGRSKVRLLRDSLRTLQYITESIVKFNPLKFFLLLSFIPLIIGLIAMIRMGVLAIVLGIFTSTLIFAMGLVTYALGRRNMS